MSELQMKEQIKFTIIKLFFQENKSIQIYESFLSSKIKIESGKPALPFLLI